MLFYYTIKNLTCIHLLYMHLLRNHALDEIDIFDRLRKKEYICIVSSNIKWITCGNISSTPQKDFWDKMRSFASGDTHGEFLLGTLKWSEVWLGTDIGGLKQTISSFTRTIFSKIFFTLRWELVSGKLRTLSKKTREGLWNFWKIDFLILSLLCALSRNKRKIRFNFFPSPGLSFPNSTW